MDNKKALVAGALYLAAASGHAMTPQELYAKLAPSVWFVYGTDASEKRVSQGSGVVVGPQKVATNCHVIQGGSSVVVRKENMLFIAKVEQRDPARDLCILHVPNLAAPAVEVSGSRELKVGQKVFALGNPRGLEVSLSDGLVSALRGPDGKEQVIQTTAPISPGSSGGGLFDESARLVGITTAVVRGAQNLNFAIPAEWIGELAERVRAAEERKASQFASARSGAAYNPAAPGLPAPGSTWKYRYRDLQFRAEQVYSVRVTGVDGWGVQETLTPEGGGSSQASRLTIGAEELRFYPRSLPGSRTIVEFAPYLALRSDEVKDSIQVPVPSGYPLDRNTNEWQVSGNVARNVSLKSPAGELATIRVDLRGSRTMFNSSPVTLTGEVARFEVRAWYSLETRRLVRLENRSWYGNSSPAADEVVDLLEYSGG